MKRRFSKWLQMFMLIAVVCVVVLPASTAVAATSNFYNVLVQNGADASVYKDTNYYYSTYTTGSEVKVWKSNYLTNMDAGTVITAWSGCCDVWAPEITKINNVWYIYFAKDNAAGDNNSHRMYVITNTSADPTTGTWSAPTKLTAVGNDDWAIDGTVLNNNGALYFIWSGWNSANQNTDQNLYIASMSSPTQLSSTRTQIAWPQYSWETNSTPHVNEGPEVIISNGQINVVFSASGSWLDSYCLGVATASTSANLLLESSWTKRTTPIFQSGNGLYGPGHHSFTKSKDGTEDWIVYHTARASGAGWNRSIRAQKFTWNDDNTPNLGIPATPNTPIAIPSGEPKRDRYEAENATFGGLAYITNHPSASNGAKVGHIDDNNSYVQFNVTVPTSGYYTVVARTDNGTSGGYSVWANFKLSVNGGATSNFSVTNSGWDNWTNATAKVFLNAGSNTIRFTYDTNYAEIDEIDIMPW